MKEFNVTDPFHGNKLEGILFRENFCYGDLLIQKVNNKPAVQYIHTTPKFYYPGHTKSHYHVDWRNIPEFDEIIAVEKVDGTNICMYPYHDVEGNIYQTFKTRLTPVLQNQKWAEFLDMWKKCLARYPEIWDLDNELVHVFELYGNLNQYFTQYDTPLDMKYLFQMKQDRIMLASVQNDLPQPECLYYEVHDKIDLSTVYENMRQVTEEKELEGVILYGFTSGNTNERPFVTFAYKCKPDSVLHYIKENTPEPLNYTAAYTTAVNALEITDDLDDLYENTVELLKEEFSQDEIDLRNVIIKDAVSTLIEEIAFQDEVMDWWIQQGFDDFIPKIVMPQAAEHFGKKKSSKVFQILQQKVGVDNGK